MFPPGTDPSWPWAAVWPPECASHCKTHGHVPRAAVSARLTVPSRAAHPLFWFPGGGWAPVISSLLATTPAALCYLLITKVAAARLSLFPTGLWPPWRRPLQPPYCSGVASAAPPWGGGALQCSPQKPLEGGGAGQAVTALRRGPGPWAVPLRARGAARPVRESFQP